MRVRVLVLVLVVSYKESKWSKGTGLGENEIGDSVKAFVLGLYMDIETGVSLEVVGIYVFTMSFTKLTNVHSCKTWRTCRRQS